MAVISAAPGSVTAERALVSSNVAVEPQNAASKVLGWVGDSGLMDSTPTGPVDSPILWAMLAAVRNPGGKPSIDGGVAAPAAAQSSQSS